MLKEDPGDELACIPLISGRDRRFAAYFHCSMIAACVESKITNMPQYGPKKNKYKNYFCPVCLQKRPQYASIIFSYHSVLILVIATAVFHSCLRK
jgi:hypothetical protein